MQIREPANSNIVPGTLVRYDETASRWFIATVHTVAVDAVTLEYLSGHREEVDPAKLISLNTFLRGREQVLSRKREDLCYLLYGRRFDRLPQSRLDEVQRFLRVNGLRYAPETWAPGTRIRIELDPSFVPKAKEQVGNDLASLLPRWLAPNRLPPGSRDPLGFQSYAERLASDILPGLTVFTSRIGYYGFIAWASKRLNEGNLASSASRRECFHRLERTLALCEFIRHGHEDRSCALLGQRSKTQILGAAVNDNFRVPSRILKNQEAAGAFRLYSTSLESNGFATQAPELGATGLLPLKLTTLGNELAGEFEKRVPDGFMEYALSDKAKSRDTLREWGKRLCFSGLGQMRFRDTFLEGFLLGGSAEAEARHRTVRLLFQRGLLQDVYEAPKRRTSRADSIAEDDVGGLEEDQEEMGLSNRDVLLRFYGEKPSADVAPLQKAAICELLSLSQTAIFAQVIAALEAGGSASVAGLADSVAADKQYGRLWKVPFNKLANKAGSVREIEQGLLEADDFATAAALGGALMARVQSDAAFNAHSKDLLDAPVMSLLSAVDPTKSLATQYSDFLQAMVARHEEVSKNKNRQRWCYLDGDKVVRDDMRPLGYGWHAMRFPQLWSLCRDLGLTRAEVSSGR